MPGNLAYVVSFYNSHERDKEREREGEGEGAHVVSNTSLFEYISRNYIFIKMGMVITVPI